MKIVVGGKDDYISLSQGDTAKLTAMREKLSRMHRGGPFLEQLLAPLVTAGYLTVQQKSNERQGKNYPYMAYSVTTKGSDLTSGRAYGEHGEVVVMLPVTDNERRLEVKQKAAAEERCKKLVDAGINVALIPSEELKDGRGPTISTFLVGNGHTKVRVSDHTKCACQITRKCVCQIIRIVRVSTSAGRDCAVSVVK
jgi:hypothetical protein